MMTNDTFLDLVLAARSVRRFVEAERIPRATLRTMIDCARRTPSAANQQPLRYRIVESRAECDAVFPHVKWAAALINWPGPAAGERPAAYIALLAPTDDAPAHDAGIVGMTLQLHARTFGLGACMLGSIDHTALQRVLAIPEQYTTHLLIALGKPAETVMLEPLPASGKTAYGRSPDGVHHVPKRSLDDVLIG